MRVSTCFAACLLLVSPVAAAPFHHAFGEWREYNRDWLAACPDVIDEDATDYYGTSCFASTGSQELNGAGLPAYKLTVLRNRITGELDIAVTVAADGVETDTSRPMIFGFSGQAPMALDFSGDLETRYNTTNQYFVADPARREQMIALMKERNGLTLTVPLTGGSAPTKAVRLSMRGVLASLDFMSAYARKVTQY